MSCSVDVNVLLYASDGSSPFHGKARALLERIAAGSELFCLTWPTIMAYLRIATHSSIFATPLNPTEATANIDSLLELPHTRLVVEGDRFWDIYRYVAGFGVVRGNTVPDVHLAALLLQNEVKTLYTNDSDFRKFDFLDLQYPFL